MFSKKLLPTILCGFFCLQTAAWGIDSGREKEDPLRRIARISLESNLVRLGSGDYLAAGAHQFYSLWTRDFCFASRGLLALGRADVVKRQLDLLISASRPEDGLVPRVEDSISSDWRVNRASLSRIFAFLQGRDPLREPLNPEYLDEHGSRAFDSNALVLLTAMDYVADTGDVQAWQEWRDRLVRIYRFYDAARDPKDGLIRQERFSDWQDSVRREGKTFYVNLLYYVVSRRLSVDPEFKIDEGALERLRGSIERTFRDGKTGLYRSLEGYTQISLEGNLLAIDWGYLDPASSEAQALYQSLRRNLLWEGGPEPVPGWVTYPDYPAEWRELAVSIAGLGHYHDQLYWSWLMALSAKVAAVMGEPAESARITERLRELVERDGAVTEVYGAEPGLPRFSSWLYLSETPFSWGSGFVVDLVDSLERLNPPRAE